MKYDFVGIGDITTDAFIKLKDAEELMDHGTRQLCVRFADKVPYEEVIEVRAVGNAANAAVAAARIGLTCALVARVGDDDNGRKCRETLKGNGVADEYVETQAGLVAEYIRAHPETKLAFQPGTFQIKLGAEGLKDVYAVTDIFFCNKEEAQKILKTSESDVKKLMLGIRALGAKVVVVTDGPNGSNILDENGAWHMPMYPDEAPPVSRTGAGDATASTTVSYIARGLVPQEALLRGMVNAASVVQGIGAQAKLLTREEIEARYEKRPADFKASLI